MVLCGTLLRPPESVGPTPIIRLASDAGCSGLIVDGGCTLATLPALLAEAGKTGLTCPTLFGPMAPGPLAPGKRLPHLSSFEDKEERLAAVKTATHTIEEARALGVMQIVLDLGPVALARPPRAVRRSFERLELDEGEPGYGAFRRLLEERRVKSPRILDACRAAIEAVLVAADRLSVALLLIPARSPWGVPSPKEVQTLLREFSGGPLGLVGAPGRRAVLDRIGLGGPAERWTDLESAVRLVYATDAVGLESDLLPGLGEVDFDALSPTFTAVPFALSGRPDSTTTEVAAARERLEALRRRPAPSAAS